MIYTYEAQHGVIKAGLQEQVNRSDWASIAAAAQDLMTLESLIAKAPAPMATSNPALATVMVHPLPTA